MRARNQSGCVSLHKRTNKWSFYWRENDQDGVRRKHSKEIGTKRQYPTEAAAWKAAKPFRDMLENQTKVSTAAPTVLTLVEQYRSEKMPERISTRHGYNAWINNHVLPRWGDSMITDVQARPVELWLQSLSLAPKSKVAIRGLVGILWDFAMWRGDITTQRNPMELVTIKNATKRASQPRSLTVEDFQKFVAQLDEPFRVIALVCVCFGLRISECLALKWSGIDWLNGRLQVERGIVRQQVGDVKTVYSKRAISIDNGMLSVLKAWKQASQFSAQEDWMFASPMQLGALPWSYPWVWRVFQKAASEARVGKLGTHTMRHTYRSWLDSVGTQIGVQQKLMRHTDIRTTFNIYGDVVTDEMAQANSKVAGLALNGR